MHIRSAGAGVQVPLDGIQVALILPTGTYVG